MSWFKQITVDIGVSRPRRSPFALGPVQPRLVHPLGKVQLAPLGSDAAEHVTIASCCATSRRLNILVT
jgi:hypothetical protein